MSETAKHNRGRLFSYLGLAVAALLVILLALLLFGWFQLRGSLPELEGEIAVEALSEPVLIERDSNGVPTIRAENRLDVARGLGFLHAQDRFFQMDLLRRQPAGELSALFGERALESDQNLRIHRFRWRAKRSVQQEGERGRALLEAYAEGVNAGLASLDAKPFEYLILRQDPEPWRPEDSVLVSFAMYLDLQDETGMNDRAYGTLKRAVPKELYEFLTPEGTEWDAPLDESRLELPPIPGPEIVNLRGVAGEPESSPGPDESDSGVESNEKSPGSNSFAISGDLTPDGRAILAGDMHLGLSLPHIWYRAAMRWTDESGAPRELTGVTLPGAPILVSGSNGHVAWAYTNSHGDWTDLVVVEETEQGRYRTPDGTREYEVIEEVIDLADGTTRSFEVRETIWGPIIGSDSAGRKYALRWVAHAPEGVNLGLMEMESVRTITEAIEAANHVGMPAQNFVIADSKGDIGWTLGGPIPRRIGERDHREPQPGTELEGAWDGWLRPDEHPRISSDEMDRIWTANARVVGGEELKKLGDGGYALGARAGQIRDRLLALNSATEEDLLAIQLDDEAIFLQRWQEHLLDLLDDEAVRGEPQRETFRELVAGWGGRASVDSAGFRMVRAFRSFLETRIFDYLTAPAKEVDPDFSWRYLDQREYPLWSLVSEEPRHLLSPEYESWRELELDVVDETIAYFTEGERALGERTWGERNRARIAHPLADAIPLFGDRLRAPATPLPGDDWMPRVQGPGYGASQRMVVSPGHEEDGYFHMPGGQSGHPLSQFFLAGHEDWEEGRPTPFLPGERVHELLLTPGH